MTAIATDLTRHDGAGACIATRLPSTPSVRPAAAAVLIERAIDRWALVDIAVDLHQAADQMLAEQVDVEPIDMLLRLSPQTITLTIGQQQLVLALHTPAVAPAI